MNLAQEKSAAIAPAPVATKKESPAIQGFTDRDSRVAVFFINGCNFDFNDISKIARDAISGNIPAPTVLPFPLRPPLEGTIESHLSAFIASLKSDKKSPKTLKCYTADARIIMRIVADAHFDGKSLNEINISQVTKEMIESAEYQLFRESKKKPKTLDRLKQGWNCFCKHIGMEDWRFTDTINTTREYRPEAISNANIVKMLEYCKHAAETAKTVTEQVILTRP